MAPRNLSEFGPTRVVVLAITPFDNDDECLRNIFSHTNWILYRVDTVAAARQFLGDIAPPVVLCDRELSDGTWKEVLSVLQGQPQPAHLIVSSHLADDRLWSEVLNCGGYDLLEKPFEPDEVFRVVSLAWRHWNDEFARTPQPVIHAAVA